MRKPKPNGFYLTTYVREESKTTLIALPLATKGNHKDTLFAALSNSAPLCCFLLHVMVVFLLVCIYKPHKKGTLKKTHTLVWQKVLDI